jgi:hypothetical protein
MPNSKNREFHKPFIKSLILITIITMFAMITSHYIVNFNNSLSLKTIEYSSHNSQFGTIHDKE